MSLRARKVPDPDSRNDPLATANGRELVGERVVVDYGGGPEEGYITEVCDHRSRDRIIRLMIDTEDGGARGARVYPGRDDDVTAELVAADGGERA